MSELEDVIVTKQKIKLGKKEIEHRDLTLYDLCDLKSYIIDLIDKEYKDNMKLAETIEDKALRIKAKSETTFFHLQRKRRPESCDLADSVEVHVYMLYLALDKQVKLSECSKWATKENLAIIQGQVEKN